VHDAFKNPKYGQKGLAMVINNKLLTKLKSKEDGFPNTGKDINTIPQSKYRVEKFLLP